MDLPCTSLHFVMRYAWGMDGNPLGYQIVVLVEHPLRLTILCHVQQEDIQQSDAMKLEICSLKCYRKYAMMYNENQFCNLSQAKYWQRKLVQQMMRQDLTSPRMASGVVDFNEHFTMWGFLILIPNRTALPRWRHATNVKRWKKKRKYEERI